MRILFFLLLVGNLSFGQNDTLFFGKVKTVRERLLFQDSLPPYKTNKWYNEYGEFGLGDPKKRIKGSSYYWQNSLGYDYVNFQREFSDIGKLLKETWFHLDDSIYKEFEYRYDKDENLVQIVTTHPFGEIDIENMVYKNCRLISCLKASVQGADNYLYLWAQYDAQDRLSKVSYFLEDGFEQEMIRVYGSDGFLSKIIAHRPEVFKKWEDGSSGYVRDSIGLSYVCQTFKFNSEGRKIEERTFYHDETVKPSMLRTFEYDHKGRLILDGFGRDSVTVKILYHYKEDKLSKTERILVNNKKNTQKIEYFYDRKDLLEKILYEDERGRFICTFTYTFDHKNNWIVQTKNVNGKPLYIRKREITYYD